MRKRFWTKKMYGRNFLLRIVLSSLLFVAIPVMVIIAVLANNQYRNIRALQMEMAADHMDKAAIELNNYFDDLRMMSIKMMISNHLDYARLQEQTYNEMEAIKWLSDFQLAVPYVGELGLYFTGTDGLYTSSGEYPMISIYESNVLLVTGFKERLNQLEASYIMGYRDGLKGNRMIYMHPSAYPTGKAMKKVMYFILTRNSLDKIFAAVIPSSYTVISIYDRQGSLLYFDDESLPQDMTGQEYEQLLHAQTGADTIRFGDYFFFSSGESAEFNIIAVTPVEPMLQQIAALRNSTNILMGIMMLICLILVISMVWVDYMPIQRMIGNIVSKYNLSEGTGYDSDELEIIYDVIELNVQEKNRYQQELSQRSNIIIAYLLLKIIDGKALTLREKKILDMERDFFIVAVANTKDFPNINAVKNRIEESAAAGERIHVLDVIYEGHIAFVCSVLDEHRETSLAKIEEILEKLDIAQIRIGCSQIFKGVKPFYQAYLEAACALEKRGAERGVCYFDEHSIDSLHDSHYFNDQMIETVQYVRSGNMTKAVTTLEKVFSLLNRPDDSVHINQYICIQMAKAYIGYLKDGSLCDREEWLNRILAISDVEKIQQEFLDLVKSNCIEIKNSCRQHEVRLASQIMAYVDAHYTDTQLCLSMICEKFDVMDYTASRIFKDSAGSGFRKYVIEKRIDKAKALLCNEHMSIHDIAAAVGFTSSSYFIRIFKDREGITPANYRESQ